MSIETIIDYCTLWPETFRGVDISACCLDHDEAYELGGGLEAFLAANADLGYCVAAKGDVLFDLWGALMAVGTTGLGGPFWLLAAWGISRAVRPRPPVSSR